MCCLLVPSVVCCTGETGTRLTAADRRAWRLHITARAQPLVAKLHAVADDMIAEAFAGIDPHDIETTRQVLGRVRENASQVAPLNRALNHGRYKTCAARGL